MSLARTSSRASGQAVWLDFVDRKFLDDGGLQKLVDEDGLTGVTSNPSIFEKAMGHGDAYDADARRASTRRNPGAATIDRYEASRDQRHPGRGRHAAPGLRPARRARTAMSAWKSRPISPTTPTATIAEARRLWEAVDRPNLMIKIPGTARRRARDPRD